MAYIVKARFYAGLDQVGESYIIVSDNNEKDTKLEVGTIVEIKEGNFLTRIFQKKSDDI